VIGDGVRNSRILVTGHSGFKGSWLTQILSELGAEVFGVSLPNQPNSLFHRLNIPNNGHFFYQDINDFEKTSNIINQIRPQIIIHLAAQPLVLESYREPLLTFQTNVMGTANILEIGRLCNSVNSVVVVTTDKVYKNLETLDGYTEESSLGGSDPYSASKSAAEMVVNSWRALENSSSRPFGICSVRAGNVIGGGDVSKDRLIPDLIRAFTSNTSPIIRNPNSVRPWQHVLEPLLGYVVLIGKMQRGESVGDAYNFGPDISARISVLEVSEIARNQWPSSLNFNFEDSNVNFKESKNLWLDSTKAFRDLGWSSHLSATEAITWTLNWEKEIKHSPPFDVTLKQIRDYLERMN
jgi:CDP-glucose 4,6-dehydratase